MSDPEVEALCQRVPGWSGRPLTAEPLEGGITNRNYLVTVDGERFVLRVPGADTGLLGIDRENEYRAASGAAAAGVGPEVVAFLPAEGNVFVTRFVSGAHIPEEDLRRDDVLSAVVRSIRALHACPPIPGTFPVFRIVEDYARIASERGVRVPAAYDEAHAVAGRIEAAFDRAPMPLLPCHDDLLNANFLRDGDHVWIVDYEYAGMGDPFFDLANLSVNNGLDGPAQELLLRRYFGEAGDAHRARLALMRLMSDFREAMWGVVQQAISTLDVDYVEYADRHFTRLLANAGALAMDDALAAAGVEIGWDRTASS
ncbi:MAG TPA: choline/ethanolamine kinase family protein [Actinomycetota bacterium]|nr:choline/ethanolamine kinase family protein [Actinomycetota bacterium]